YIHCFLKFFSTQQICCFTNGLYTITSHLFSNRCNRFIWLYIPVAVLGCFLQSTCNSNLQLLKPLEIQGFTKPYNCCSTCSTVFPQFRCCHSNRLLWIFQNIRSEFPFRRRKRRKHFSKHNKSTIC